MGTICLQCGDVGFDNACVYCVICVKSAVHRYCLPEIPKSFDEIVRWVCDDCEAVSSASVGQKVLLTTQDGRCIKRVISTPTSYSNEKSISQSLLGADENDGRTEPILQSVHENLGSSADARLADDDCCLPGGEPNADNDLSWKEHEYQSNTSLQNDEVEEVAVAADDSLQRTRLRKKTSLSWKEEQTLPTSSDQKRVDDGRQSDTSSQLSGEEEAETKHEHESNISRKLNGVKEVNNMTTEESLQRTRLRKLTEVSSSLSEKEKQNTSSGQKIFDGEPQSETSSRHSGEEEAEMAADKLSKRRKIRENSDISSAVTEKEKQKQTTSNDCFIAYKKIVDDTAPLAFSPLRNECRSSNSVQVHGVEHATKVVAEGSSQRKKLDVKRHISASVAQKEKQMRCSTPSHQFRSRQHTQSRDRSLRYPPSCNEPRRVRSRSLDNNSEQRYSGPSSRENHNSRRPMHNTVQRYSGPSSRENPNSRRPMHNTVREREKKHVIEKSLVIPTRRNVNPEFSKQTHEARRPMHHTGHEFIPTQSKVHEEVSRHTQEARKTMHENVRERHKERVKEKSSVIPTRSNGNEEVSQQTREARRHMHDTVTVREKVKEQEKEEPLVIPTQSNVRKEVFQQTHEARKPMNNTVHERYKDRAKEEPSVIPTRSNSNEEVSLDPKITQLLQVQPVVDPIWRGRFDIVNKKDDIFEGFVAHLSSRACPQVIDEARLLPALLQLEMVPKSLVWPKSFRTIQPSDDNIALYIFPANRRYEKVFDRLVGEMSDQELAMRAITTNAELLIFPSTELPMKYWRFQNKYFIWGVFRAKRPTSADTLENHTKETLG